MEIRDLRPGDVLFFYPEWGILNPLVKLLLTYDHTAIYETETKRHLPLICESIGRGALRRSLLCYAGRLVVVMRPVDEIYGGAAAKAAERLVDNPHSFYGYYDIPRFVLPKLILAKLGWMLPPRVEWVIKLMAFTYHHNRVYICSELVCQAYDDVKYPLLDERTIPLPDDVAQSPRLKYVGEILVPRNGR